MSKNVRGRKLRNLVYIIRGLPRTNFDNFKTRMCPRAVRDWLVLLTMEKYIDNFLERGYDCIAHCKLIICSDLVMLGVDDESHRKLLLDGVLFLINSPEFTCSEPCEMHRSLELEDENSYDEFAATKFSERFNFMDSPKNQVDEAPSPPRLFKTPLLSPSVKRDRDELSVSPRKSKSLPNQLKRLKCRKVLDMEEEEVNTNYVLID